MTELSIEQIKSKCDEIRNLTHSKTFIELSNMYSDFFDRYPSIFRALFDMDKNQLDYLLDRYQLAQRRNSIEEEKYRLSLDLTKKFIPEKFLSPSGMQTLSNHQTDPEFEKLFANR